MKSFLTVLLVAGMLASCSATAGLENATQVISPGGKSGGVSATGQVTLEATMNDTTSHSRPAVITVRPPKIPIGPASTPLAGWQTFTSPALGVAVDYPGDWSVVENAEGVSFTPQQGQPVFLQTGNSNNSPSTQGQDCATLINSYGQAGKICLDATTSAYRAVFKKSADRSTVWVELSVTSQEKPNVFFQMFDSFRFVP